MQCGRVRQQRVIDLAAELIREFFEAERKPAIGVDEGRTARISRIDRVPIHTSQVEEELEEKYGGNAAAAHGQREGAQRG